MKTNSHARVDRDKNRIYLTLEGSHDLEEAVRMKNEYKKAIAQCRRGFTVLTDVRNYIPGSGEVQKVHEEAVELAEQGGVSRVARVVGETPLGGMQIDRIAKKHIHYSAGHFATVEEAEEFLDS